MNAIDFSSERTVPTFLIRTPPVKIKQVAPTAYQLALLTDCIWLTSESCEVGLKICGRYSTSAQLATMRYFSTYRVDVVDIVKPATLKVSPLAFIRIRAEVELSLLI
jgi:hypothetical protein